jgi:GT2 family glycosyltransferase/glycosyltransferase involved in cell wall biosynthesis
MYQANNDLRRYFENNPGRLLHKWLHYFEIYDHHFQRYRSKPVSILEIGVFHGGSIQLWKDYFGPQAKIYGVDIDPRCKQFEEENVQIIVGDQGDRAFLRQLKHEIPRPDILIDDGGHLMHQQIATFEELYPFVAEDGIYLCEDLHTSYWPDWGGGLRKPSTFIEYSKRLIDSLHGFHSKAIDRDSPSSITRSAHSLHFYDSVLVIEKQARDSMPTDGYSGKPIFESGSIGSVPTPIFTFAVLTADPKGASRVEERLFIPNGLEGSRFRLVYGGWKDASENKYVDEHIHTADGYIIHGQFPDYLSSDVLNHIFKSGKPIVFFFDESLPELISGELRTKSGFRQYLIECLRLSHLVVVENEAQKDIYRILNPRITILPQKLDVRRYAPAVSTSNEILRVIYHGNEGHLADLLLIAEALKTAADRHPGKLEFHLFGRGLAALGDHPSFHFNPLIKGQHELDEAIRRIRPGLALLPLREDADQGLASTLSLLEYAAYGIPVMASNVPPYQGCIRQWQTGVLAENTTDSWLHLLEEYVAKDQMRISMSKEIRSWLKSERAVNDKGDNLAAIFEQAIRDARATRKNKPNIDFQTLYKPKPYQDYLRSQRLLPRDVRWMQEEIKRWDSFPQFHLLMTLLPGQTQWLANTLNSLDTQIYPNWKLTIVAFTPKPEELHLPTQACWYELGDDEDSYEALNRLAMEEGSNWVGFVEAGDILQQQALFKLAFHARLKPEWRVIYSDEDQISVENHRSNPLFKPDYNPDLLLAYDYIGGLCLFDTNLFSTNGGVSDEKDGTEVYDLLLRCTEQILPSAIGHLAEVLYTRFDRGGHSTRSWEEITQSAALSLQEHFFRRGVAAEVKRGPVAGVHQIVYPLTHTPPVSILIPTRDHLELIKPCIDTLLEKTNYPNYEVLILNNDSRDPEVLDYFAKIRQHPRIRILDYPHPFNFSAICNYGAQQATGEFLLLLNNDTEITQPEWLSEMMRHGLRPDVGVVGARLLFPDGTLQHAGIVMGLGMASHVFPNSSPDLPGYMHRAQVAQNYSAVTGACLLVRRDLYQSLGGMDEVDLKVLFNDVDFCLRVREAGHLVVWTPSATLIHKTSASLNKVMEGPTLASQMAQATGEHHTICRRWLKWMAFDPAYNRNLSMESNDFSIDVDPTPLAWDPDWRPAPRILAYPGDFEGCGEYRVIAPCRALNEAGRAQAYVSKKLYYPSQFAKVDPDVIILQRQVEDNHLFSIGGIKRYSRAFRVFEIDDLLHDLPAKSVHRNVMHGDELERLVEAISLCDRFVTTSTVLADAYGRYSKDVKIVPNFLERAKWGQLQPSRLERKKPRVGWAGGASHTGDLLLVHEVIKALHKEVDWIFFGMCPEPLRPYVHEFHSPVKLDSYPAKLASLNLDLALAPLEYNPFNDAKSALKILEYGILGYPVICTDIVTYQGDFPVTRVSNNAQDWIEAIRNAIADRDQLAISGNLLKAHIQNHWMLEDNLDKWLEGWLP